MTKKLFLILVFLFSPLFLNASDISTSYLDTKIVLFPIHKVIVASLVDSFIKKYNVKQGDTFKKGEVLILLNNQLYKQTYLKSKADLTVAYANFKYANNIFKHNKKLYKKEAIGSQELGKSEIEKIDASTNLETAKANLKISEIKLNACTIKAPFSGRFLKKILFSHEFVKSGQPIAEIIDDNLLLAVMNLPSTEIKNIKKNDILKFKIDETQTIYSGRIYSISGSVNPGSRTFEIKAVIKNKNKKLRAGMSGVLIKK